MVYDSVYEANNYLRGTVRKQHFWDWFSGSKLQEGVTGTNSYSTAFPNATGWSSRGTQTSITGGLVDTDFGATDDNSAVLRSLGYNISGDFEFRIKHRFISYTSSTSGMIALADSTNPVYNPVTAGSNSVMIGVNSDSSGQHSFAFYSVENGVFTNHGDPPISTGKTGILSNGTDYWLKMTKVGNLVTINVYSDSSYSSLVTSCYGSVSSSFPSTLNSIQIGMAWTMSGRGAHWTDTDLSLTSDVVGGIRWTTSDITHTGTYSMVDEADEGFSILSSTNGARSALGFNNIRQFSPTASVAIFNLKRMTDASHDSYAGFKYDDTNSTFYDTAVVSQASYATNIGLYTGDASTATNLESTTPRDTAWHGYKIENGSANIKLTIDGVVDVTKTTNRPSKQMQPFVLNSTNTSATRETRINYFEAYNT